MDSFSTNAFRRVILGSEEKGPGNQIDKIRTVHNNNPFPTPKFLSKKGRKKKNFFVHPKDGTRKRVARGLGGRTLARGFLREA